VGTFFTINQKPNRTEPNRNFGFFGSSVRFRFLYLRSSVFGICRRFETGGSLGRRVKCRRVPQPRWVGARPSAKGGERWPETGVREVEIPRPSCSSRAQVGCACSRGLQASTRERERAASRECLSRPRPRAANPL
jgi:hypothetical protein